MRAVCLMVDDVFLNAAYLSCKRVHWIRMSRMSMVCMSKRIHVSVVDAVIGLMLSLPCVCTVRVPKAFAHS